MPRKTRIGEKPEQLTTIYTLILDRSGSMGSLRKSVIEGVNEWINGLKVDQEQNPDNPHLLSFYQFDSQWPRPILETINSLDPVSNCVPLTEGSYIPRGGTPLFDAVCQAIRDVRVKSVGVTGKKAYLVAIMTDGYENASTSETKDSLKKLIEECEKDGFTFVYMGANQDAMAEALKFGTQSMGTNSLDWQATDTGTRTAYANFSGSTQAYSQSMRKSASTGGSLVAENFFSQYPNTTSTADAFQGVVTPTPSLKKPRVKKVKV
jgi:hypothetical protein